MTVLYKLKTPIGTAILFGKLSETMKQTSHEGAERYSDDGRVLPLIASSDAVDPNKIAVICDLKLCPDRPELGCIRCEFFEWYEISFLKKLKALHFPNAKHEPPKMHTTKDLSACRACFGMKTGFHSSYFLLGAIVSEIDETEQLKCSKWPVRTVKVLNKERGSGDKLA